MQVLQAVEAMVGVLFQAVGRLLVGLACVGSSRAAAGMDIVSAQYSVDFTRILTLLLAASDSTLYTPPVFL